MLIVTSNPEAISTSLHLFMEFIGQPLDQVVRDPYLVLRSAALAEVFGKGLL